jgi:HK97 family phage portal protein
MNILHKFLGTEELIQKAVSMATIANIDIQSQLLRMNWNIPTYISNDAVSLFKRAYEENIIFYAVADRIAEKFGHLARYHYKKVDAKKKSYQTKSLDQDIANSELMDLLLTPNDMQGQDEFFYLVGFSFKTCNEAFIWKNRGDLEGGKPLELYVLPPWVISPVSDGTMFGVKHYLLQINGGLLSIPVEDIIHWKKPHLALDMGTGAHLRSFNPLIAQKKTLQQSHDITDAEVSMYQNGGAKHIIFNKNLGDLTKEQEEKLKDLMKKKVNNKDMKAAVTALQGEWGGINLGLSSVDMQLIEAEDKVIDKICFSLGFPSELYRTDTTFANKKDAWMFFITNTLMPMAASFDNVLTKNLVKDFKDNGFIKTDFYELPEMQQARLDMALSLKEMWQLTPNQKLEIAGFDKSTDPLMDRVYIPTGLMPIGEISVGEPIDNPEEEDYKR